MDPSLSVSNDPHHPPQFTAYPPFTNSNPFANSAPPNHPFFASAPPNNNHMFQPPPTPIPPPPPSTHPSIAHPPYSDMICSAIAALNEPDGSSKQAISRYIERTYPGVPAAHGALLTHHLKTLKNSGILMMVRKSYKFAVTPPPTSVALAAAAALEPPRSDFTVNENQLLPDPVATVTPPTQKRGRGRPPKAKPEAQPQTNGKPNWEQTELPVESQIQPQLQIQAEPQIQPQVPAKRPPGRPRKDGALPTVKAASVSGGVETVKRRGRPPSGRAAGRERKPTVVSAPASVFPYVANGGVRRRGRPKRVDAGASSVAQPPPPPLPVNAESGGEVVAKKRGRGRPPKIGGVVRKPMKLRRGIPRSGRPVGRPRKTAVSIGAPAQEGGDYRELKKKFELFQAKAKDIVTVLKDEIGGSGNQAVVQAIQDLEGLTETTNEPQYMEEVEPQEDHADEPEPEGQGQGQGQTEAEAMQEALF